MLIQDVSVIDAKTTGADTTCLDWQKTTDEDEI